MATLPSDGTLPAQLKSCIFGTQVLPFHIVFDPQSVTAEVETTEDTLDDVYALTARTSIV